MPVDPLAPSVGPRVLASRCARSTASERPAADDGGGDDQPAGRGGAAGANELLSAPDIGLPRW
ncbi:hypothetical protein JWS13_01085 (plasmid) [Rhodococcus pseudokoreensis]|uniref:Uncharacterized protein n=1 Tax=Rhodococcus pseudokoreensis TaxID=2811421 RepID=A0A974VY21_9NOCA|nr:hypothetical protein [Rhodococcus pseudokoreensis]QSE87302.1 hypothetical protein JWS13_01085 [Rhodococcus pseudokoreensis]